MVEHQTEVLKRLRQENRITYDEIAKIADAFQIASAQGLAIGKTKGMLDFLLNHGEIIVSTDKEIKAKLKTNYDLAHFYRSIDKEISIENDINFDNYF